MWCFGLLANQSVTCTRRQVDEVLREPRASRDRELSRRTYARVRITVDGVEVVFERQLEDRVRGTTLLLRSVDPVCTEFDGQLAIGCAKCGAAHAAAKFISCLDNEEIGDALCDQRARGDDARDTPAKYKYLCVWRLPGQGHPRGECAGNVTGNWGWNRSWECEYRAHEWAQCQGMER